MEFLDNRYWLDEAKDDYPGWVDIIEACHKEVKKVDPDYRIDQIKEKFGGLRFYFSLSEKARDKEANWAIYEKVTAIADRSFNICERCGTGMNVSTEGKGWIRTLCLDCRKKDINE